MSKIYKHLKYILGGLAVIVWLGALAVLLIVDPYSRQVVMSAPASYPIGVGINFYYQGQSAQVEAIYTTQELKYQTTEIVVKSDSVLDWIDIPQGWQIHPAVDQDFTYVIETSQIKNGKNEYLLHAKDQNGYMHQLSIVLNAAGTRSIAPVWEGKPYSIDADDLLTLANKNYRLSMHYEPKDIVPLAKYKIRNRNNAEVREVMIADLVKMTDAITKAGIEYKITSGYRSYDLQVEVYNYWLELQEGSVPKTDAFSARAGHSEHQLGTTIDFVSEESYDTFYQFETTKLAKWLKANAYKYGFIMSYPKGKQKITGYTFEPWHFRYVGRENAKLIFNSKLTLTEWLVEYHGTHNLPSHDIL